MQEARSDVNGAIYTALQLEALPEGRRRVIRSELRCEACGELAHYRSRSSDGRRRPHFFCRPHLESCAYIRIAGDPWGDDDEGRINAASERGGKLVVKIDGLDASGDENGSGDAESDVGEGDARTRRAGSNSREQLNVSRGPQRILELLVGSPAFRTSACLVRFRDSSELPIHRAFVMFQQANSHGMIVEDHLKSIGMMHDPEMSDAQKALIAEKRKQIAQREGSKKNSDVSGAPRAPSSADDHPEDIEITGDGASFPPSATMCHKCSTKALVLMDGCATCLNCGYSKCG